MDRFEYYIKEEKLNVYHINLLGENGWELVSYMCNIDLSGTKHHYIFKRKLKISDTLKR